MKPFPAFFLWLCPVMGTAAAVTAPGQRTDAPTAEDAKIRAAFTQMVEEREQSEFWRRIQMRNPKLASRDLFQYALLLAESGQHLDRLGQIFDLAASMQDSVPTSPTYGNFRWILEHGAVLDSNAVEFCMQPASLILLRWRNKIPPPVAAELERICRLAVKGLKHHHVPPSYTNIALLNAQNLMLLGRALNVPEAEQEGVERFRRFLLYTWRNGIHEYDSPTYYAVDLGALMLIRTYARPKKARLWAEALLEYFWTDIAANYFPPAKRLAGTNSRTYDYLHGLGGIAGYLRAAGWLDTEDAGDLPIPALLAPRPVPEHLRKLAFEHFPREVEQSWGASPSAYKVHYLMSGITLGTSGTSYGRPIAAHDMPLTIDFPGPRTQVRCYLIADARRDPYGKKKFKEPGGPHAKALHLGPYFSAVQRRTDALALVVYRPHDFPETPATLETHLVMPLDVDDVWIGSERIKLGDAAPFVHEIPPDRPLAVRKGSAAFAVRMLWTRALNGAPGRAALIYDGNPYRAMRLTVAHHTFWGDVKTKSYPGAVFWVRIGDGLTSDASFEAWRDRFTNAAGKVQATARDVHAEVAGTDGVLAISAAAPFLGTAETVPSRSHALLAIDGEDVGRAILRRLEVCRNWKPPEQRAPVVKVGGKETFWEAESGAVEGDMRIGHDDEAFGGAFVWMPGEIGGKGGGEGSVTWRLEVASPGRYYLWGRVLSPTPEDDSFFVRVFTKQRDIVARSAWHLDHHERWGWDPLVLRDAGLDHLDLPGGTVFLQIRVREDGAKLDRLFITSKPTGHP